MPDMTAPRRITPPDTERIAATRRARGRRPLKRVRAGLYTTPDRAWRIENLDVVLHGRGGRGSWELYRQNFDTVDIRGIDPRATFVDTFKSLTAACAAI